MRVKAAERLRAFRSRSSTVCTSDCSCSSADEGDCSSEEDMVESARRRLFDNLPEHSVDPLTFSFL